MGSPKHFQFLGRGRSATITFVAGQLNHGSPLLTRSPPVVSSPHRITTSCIKPASLPSSAQEHRSPIRRKLSCNFLCKNDACLSDDKRRVTLLTCLLVYILCAHKMSIPSRLSFFSCLRQKIGGKSNASRLNNYYRLDVAFLSLFIASALK